jgi:hypothetical protein
MGLVMAPKRENAQKEADDYEEKAGKTALVVGSYSTEASDPE